MKSTTHTYYKQKVEDVLHYIHNHLNDTISIKELAEYSGISLYHFHRVVKGALNEPLGTYIDKARLDTAVKLIRYSDESINSISAQIGYNDVSSFSKAFSKQFGISPQEYKLNREITLNTKIDYHLNSKGQLVADINPKIIHLPDKNAISIRVIGEYGGEEVVEAWELLLNFIKEHKLLGWNPEFFSIYYDDPETVDREKCSSDLCFVTKKTIEADARFATGVIKGGKFAVFRYKGPYERLWELYDMIYGKWLLSVDYKLRDKPLLEKYINYSPKTKPENLLTEIYIPIE